MMTASINNLALIYNAKNAASFYSGSWNTGTNPDLAFVNVGPCSHLLNRCVLEKFSMLQHSKPFGALTSQTLIEKHGVF